MKRAHRRWHAPAWLIVAAVSVVVLWLAVNGPSPLPADANVPAPPSSSDGASPRPEGG
jgi:hypothetical protein